MELIKRPDGWWITGIPDCQDAGPYDTKTEADEDRRGLDRFYRQHVKRPSPTE